MNNFQSFGKVLTRDEQRKIRGGEEPSDTLEPAFGCSQELDFCGTNREGQTIKCCPEDHSKCINNECIK